MALVAELAAEAFLAAILPRLAWIDQCGIDACLVQPLEHGATDELGSVVGSQVARCAVNADQATEHLAHTAGADAALNVDLQALARPLVDDGQALQLLAIGAGIDHKVIGPHLVRPRRRQGPRLIT